MGKARKVPRGAKVDSSEPANEAAIGTARGNRGARMGVRGMSKEVEEQTSASGGGAGAGANHTERQGGRERRASDESDMPETKRFRKCESSTNNSDLAARAAAREAAKSVHSITNTAHPTAASAVNGSVAEGNGSGPSETKGEAEQAKQTAGKADSSVGALGDDKNAGGEFGTPQHETLRGARRGATNIFRPRGRAPPPDRARWIEMHSMDLVRLRNGGTGGKRVAFSLLICFPHD